MDQADAGGASDPPDADGSVVAFGVGAAGFAFASFAGASKIAAIAPRLVAASRSISAFTASARSRTLGSDLRFSI